MIFPQLESFVNLKMDSRSPKSWKNSFLFDFLSIQVMSEPHFNRQKYKSKSPKLGTPYCTIVLLKTWIGKCRWPQNCSKLEIRKHLLTDLMTRKSIWFSTMYVLDDKTTLYLFSCSIDTTVCLFEGRCILKQQLCVCSRAAASSSINYVFVRGPLHPQAADKLELM